MSDKEQPKKKKKVKTKGPANNAANQKQTETLSPDVLANLQVLVNTMLQGILFTSKDRRILFANQAFCDLFRISSPGTILGADCSLMAEQAKHAFIDPEGFLSTMERRLEIGRASCRERVYENV
jgi:PAS domain-containing protein